MRPAAMIPTRAATTRPPAMPGAAAGTTAMIATRASGPAARAAMPIAILAATMPAARRGAPVRSAMPTAIMVAIAAMPAAIMIAAADEDAATGHIAGLAVIIATRLGIAARGIITAIRTVIPITTRAIDAACKGCQRPGHQKGNKNAFHNDDIVRRIMTS